MGTVSFHFHFTGKAGGLVIIPISGLLNLRILSS